MQSTEGHKYELNKRVHASHAARATYSSSNFRLRKVEPAYKYRLTTYRSMYKEQKGTPTQTHLQFQRNALPASYVVCCRWKCGRHNGTRKATTNCRASRQSSSSPSSEACSSATLSSHCPQTDFMYPGRLLQLLLRQQSLLTGCQCSPCFVWCASVWGSHACVFVYWVV